VPTVTSVAARCPALVETVEEINLSGRGRQYDPLVPHRLDGARGEEVA
jgi:hypothetical protein